MIAGLSFTLHTCGLVGCVIHTRGFVRTCVPVRLCRRVGRGVPSIPRHYDCLNSDIASVCMRAFDVFNRECCYATRPGGSDHRHKRFRALCGRKSRRQRSITRTITRTCFQGKFCCVAWTPNIACTHNKGAGANYHPMRRYYSSMYTFALEVYRTGVVVGGYRLFC